jgi:sulfate permease, SulP family
MFRYAFEKVKRHHTPTKRESVKNYFFWLMGTARNAIVVGLGIVVARIVAATNDDHVFRLVRDVPDGLPTAVNPLGAGAEVGEVLTAAVVIALISYLESVAIAKTYAQKDGYAIDPTQELRALGLANIVGSFFQA